MATDGRNDPVVAPRVLTQTRRSTALAAFRPPPTANHAQIRALFSSLLVSCQAEAVSYLLMAVQ